MSASFAGILESKQDARPLIIQHRQQRQTIKNKMLEQGSILIVQVRRAHTLVKLDKEGYSIKCEN